MTFVEFIRLLDRLANEPERLLRLVETPPELSAAFDGNIRCALQEGALCGAREGRCLSCRLEGLTVLDGLFGRLKPLCAHAGEKGEMPRADAAFIEELLARLNRLNEPFYPLMAEPYYLDGLTLECWLAVCLDPGIAHPVFLELRRLAQNRHDLGFLRERYENHTKMKEKIDTIDAFYAAVQEGRVEEARKLAKILLDEFPFTGSFFHWQAQALAQALED
jgi:hypothetical protein